MFRNNSQVRKLSNKKSLHLKKRNFLKRFNNLKDKQKNKPRLKRSKLNNKSNPKNPKISWVTWERRRKMTKQADKSLYQLLASWMKKNCKCCNQWFKRFVKTQHLWANQFNSLTMMWRLWTKNYNSGEDNITHQKEKCKANLKLVKNLCYQFMIKLLRFKTKLKTKKQKFKMQKLKSLRMTQQSEIFWCQW